MKSTNVIELLGVDDRSIKQCIANSNNDRATGLQNSIIRTHNQIVEAELYLRRYKTKMQRFQTQLSQRSKKYAQVLEKIVLKKASGLPNISDSSKLWVEYRYQYPDGSESIENDGIGCLMITIVRLISSIQHENSKTRIVELGAIARCSLTDQPNRSVGRYEALKKLDKRIDEEFEKRRLERSA